MLDMKLGCFVCSIVKYLSNSIQLVIVILNRCCLVYLSVQKGKILFARVCELKSQVIFLNRGYGCE